MELTYRYRIYPSRKQEEIILRTCAGVRFFYNKLLEQRTAYYRKHGTWQGLNTLAFEGGSWAQRMDPYALKSAQNQLIDAYDNFFRILRMERPEYRPEALQRAQTDPSFKLMDCDLIGYPKHKTGYETLQSYQTQPGGVKLLEKSVLLPCLGTVKAVIHRPLPDGADIVRCTILKKRSGKYYLNLLIRVEDKNTKQELYTPLGIAFEPGNLALRSDDKKIEFKHMDPELEWHIEQAYRTLKRRTPGSKRYEKQRKKLARLCEKRSEQRKDDLHKAACSIARDADIVCMEAPEVISQIRSFKRAGVYEQVHDEAWWRFARLVEQKVVGRGHMYLKVPRKDPLFDTCCMCGLKDRWPNRKNKTFYCRYCGQERPRAENAVWMLFKRAAQYMSFKW